MATSQANLSTHRYAVPVVCAAVAMGGTIGVIELADAATESDGLAALDPQFTANVASSRTPALTALARAFTFVGSGPVLVTLLLIAMLILWRWTHGLRASALLLFAMAGSTALTAGVKALVARKRPDITFVLGPVEDSFAFPSGHTLNSTVFFITLAGLLWVGLRSYGPRTALAVAALLMSLGIGLSRIYLGHHWATDVLAGWTVAATWLALVCLVAYISRESRHHVGEA